jgi:glycosyltransferase involved in cell wall biosynthesis
VKVALLTEIPAPFRVPLFNALAEQVDLRVFFLAARDPRRTHYRVHEDEMRFDYRILDGRELSRGGRWLVVSRGTRRALREFRPEAVIVGGWNQPAMWLARRRGRPTFVWVESTLRDERPGLAPLEWLKRRFVRSATGAIVPGEASAAYVRSLGVPDEQIHVAPNAVDTSIFGIGRRAHDGCVFLYVGRLDREKGVDLLLQAFEGVTGELLVVGGGAENERLREAAGRGVSFLGKLDRDDLPRVYAGADVLVLPSLSEPWGMVLNEGAAAGLALVATDAVGAAFDLIEDGGNGLRVPAGDVPALRGALLKFASDPDLRERFGARSRELARSFTPEAWAAGVLEGLKAAAVPSSR